MAKRPRRVAAPEPKRIKMARYYDVEGKRCAKSTPGAIKRTELSDSYYAWLKVGNKFTRFPLKTSDLGNAWVELKKLQRRLLMEDAGIKDEYIFQSHRIDFEKHIEDWLATVRSEGVTAKQLHLLGADVRRLKTIAGWTTIADITSSSAKVALGKLQSEHGLSAQTRNHYLAHLKQFARWLDRDKRIKDDPLETLQPISVESDRRHDRRCPSDDEIARLLEYLQGPRAKVRRGMTGPQRALGYKISMATGYRAQELRSLTLASFDWDRSEVTVVASYSKRRRTDTQQLPPWLAKEVKAWIDAGGQLWGGFAASYPGRILIADLTAAAVPYSVPGKAGEPLFFDFHAFRHWYVTWAANVPGMSPRTLLALTRLSSVELAMKVYGKGKVDEQKKAVGMLPDIGKLQKKPDPK